MGLYDRDYMRERLEGDEKSIPKDNRKFKDEKVPSILLWLIMALAFVSIALTLYFSVFHRL